MSKNEKSVQISPTVPRQCNTPTVPRYRVILKRKSFWNVCPPLFQKFQHRISMGHNHLTKLCLILILGQIFFELILAMSCVKWSGRAQTQTGFRNITGKLTNCSARIYTNTTKTPNIFGHTQGTNGSLVLLINRQPNPFCHIKTGTLKHFSHASPCLCLLLVIVEVVHNTWETQKRDVAGRFAFTSRVGPNQSSPHLQHPPKKNYLCGLFIQYLAVCFI